MRLILIILAFVLVSGCSGKVYTVQDPKFIGGKTEGVLFYGYKVADKKIVLDRIRHKKTGDITHSMYELPGSGKYCSPQIKIKKEVIADFSTLYAVMYEPGLFETNTFGVELDKGMLKAVNSQSTPGLKTAVDSLQGLADIREDILDGFVKASEASSEKTLSSVVGVAPQALPIKCSSNE